MAGRKRTTKEREADLVKVARYYCQGLTLAAIGEKMELTGQQIGYDLKIIRKRWAETYVDFAEAKERELAKIDNLEQTYWDAWLRSCEAAVTAATKLVTDKRRFQEAQAQGRTPPSDRVDVTTRKEEQVGDPRFLAGVERCIKMRRDMLGLDAPDKVAFTDTTGKHTVDYLLSPAQVRAMVDAANAVESGGDDHS